MLRKKRGKKKNDGGEKRRDRRRKRRKNGGCERQLKEAGVRVSASQAKLAGRVDTDRESGGGGGWTEESAKRTRRRRTAGDEGGTRVSGERVAGGRIGENRARLGFAMTNGRRGHSARRSYRSKRDYHVGLSPWSASLFARVTSSVLGEDPSSFSFFRLGPPYRAVFSFCPCDLSPGLSSSHFFLPFLYRFFAS